MDVFVLAWVLMTWDAHGAFNYSPPVKTLEDCQMMQNFVEKRKFSATDMQCVQIKVLRGAR